MSGVTPLNRIVLRTIWAHMAGRVRYCEGAKAPSLDCDTAAIKEIDCSGFVRYAIARATGGKLILPDGSVTQHAWCAGQKLERQDYSSEARKYDNLIRVNFLSPARAAEVGRPGDRHVWLTQNGWTMESHGGGGCVARDWDTWILEQCDASFLMPSYL